MNHAYMPIGPVGKPTELHLAFPILTFQFTKAPQACKALSAFMLEAENFNPWVEAAQGYLSHFLHRLRQEPGLDRRSEAHAVSRRLQAHADARRPGLARREGGGRDRRLHRGGHVRELRDRPRGRQGRDRGGRAPGEAHLSLSNRTPAAGAKPAAGFSVIRAGANGRMVDVSIPSRQASAGRNLGLEPAQVEPSLARLLVHAAGDGDPGAVPRLSARARRLAVVHRRQDRPQRRVHRLGELRVAVGRFDLLALGVQHAALHDRRQHHQIRRRAFISRCCSTSTCRSRRSSAPRS